MTAGPCVSLAKIELIIQDERNHPPRRSEAQPHWGFCRVIELVEQLLPGMPTREFAGPAWRDFGQVIVVDDLAEAYVLADEIASEHVEVLTDRPRDALAAMRNYGALFLGEGTCVSYGDRVIGTNHTLPTRRTARHSGGLWVGRYLKTVTYQEVTDPRASAERARSAGGSAASSCSRVTPVPATSVPLATPAPRPTGIHVCSDTKNPRCRSD